MSENVPTYTMGHRVHLMDMNALLGKSPIRGARVMHLEESKSRLRQLGQ